MSQHLDNAVGSPRFVSEADTGATMGLVVRLQQLVEVR